MNKKDIHSAAQALGKLGGLAKSKAKAKAVRENGKLGGRPVGSKNMSNFCPNLQNTHVKTKTQNQRKAESNAHKAFSHYLATRRAYRKGQATIEQVAHTLAVFDLTLAIANLKRQ